MKKISLIIICLMLTLGISVSVYAKDVKDLQDELKGVNDRVKQTEQQLKDVKNKKQTAYEEKLQIEKQIQDTENRLEEINKLLEQTNNKITSITAELESAEKDVKKQYQTLKLRARIMDEQGKASYMQMLLDSRSIPDFLSRLQIVKEVVKYDSELLKEFDENKNKIANAKQELEKEKQNRQDLKEETTSKKKLLETKRAEREALLAKLKKDEESYEKARIEMQEYSEKLGKEIKRLQDLSKKYAGGELCWPVPNNYRITSVFGTRVHPVYGTRRFHGGIDIAAWTGTDVVAANDGTVKMAGWYGGYGKCVMIDHGGGIATLYGHNSRIRVKVGQKVKKGDIISNIGSTGVSTGPHLHFEVREKGTRVNPMKYLKNAK